MLFLHRRRMHFLGYVALALLLAATGCVTPQVSGIHGGSNALSATGGMVPSHSGGYYQVAMPVAPPAE